MQISADAGTTKARAKENAHALIWPPRAIRATNNAQDEKDAANTHNKTKRATGKSESANLELKSANPSWANGRVRSKPDTPATPGVAADWNRLFGRLIIITPLFNSA